MTITALPHSTIRQLGSSVAITTPPDVIKELLENSIDAQATFVEITVSPDALSELKVRDNGTGMSLDDVQVLARKAHTSKLGNFEELQWKGGRTLGFRGEALASIASISDVVVTTRTADDPVASKFKVLSEIGGIDGDIRPVAAPVGTMIRAQGLFKNLPVRRRQWEKHGQRSISKMTELLRTYAFARPYLKIHLKVQGSPQPAYTYNPTSAASAREATLQLFGAAVSASCMEVRSEVDLRPSLSSEQVHSGAPNITLQAYIPKSGCPASTIASRGPFISVDSRPISARRGFGQKLVQVFKSYLKVSGVAVGSSVASPFLHLNIQCTPGAYDPNVTPLKDEVLFAEEAVVLKGFECLCESVFSAETDFTVKILEDDGSHLPGSSLTPGLSDAALSDANNLRPKKDTKVNSQDMLVEQSQRSLTRAEVRLRSAAVNMSRTSSNSTDGPEANQVLEIEVSEPVTFEPKPKSSKKQLHRSMFGAHQIENYLKAVPELDFAIAIDGTATSPGRTEKRTVDPIQYPGEAARVPLHELGESAINARVSGYREHRSSPVLPVPRHIASRGTRSPVARAQFKEIGTAIDGEGSPMVPQPWPQMLRESRPSPVANSSQTRPVHNHIDFLTPPSSDPLRDSTSMSQAFWHRERPETPPGYTGTDQQGIDSSQHSLQAGEASQTLSRRQLHLNLNGRLLTGLSDHPNSEHELRSGDFPQQSSGQDIDLTNGLNGDWMVPYSHALQSILMQTPAPTQRKVSEPTNIRSPRMEAKAVASCQASAQNRIKRKRQEADGGLQESSFKTLEDPRQYFIRDRQAGKHKRMPSKNLPLEVIPQGDSTHRLFTVLSLQLHYVEDLTVQLRPAERRFPLMEEEACAWIDNLHEVEEVEVLLRDTVDAWRASIGDPGIIEYTFTTGVKGKGRI